MGCWRNYGDRVGRVLQVCGLKKKEVIPQGFSIAIGVIHFAERSLMDERAQCGEGMNTGFMGMSRVLQ